MHNGKTPIYGVLLMAALPYEFVALLFDKGGIVDFRGQKPLFRHRLVDELLADCRWTGWECS